MWHFSPPPYQFHFYIIESYLTFFQYVYETVKIYVMKTLINTEYSAHVRSLGYFVFECYLFHRNCTVSIPVLTNTFSTIHTSANT